MEKLTEDERIIAEQNHNLIYSFIWKKNLDVDEWYGILSIGYLKGIKKYIKSECKHSLSTYVYNSMYYEYLDELRRRYDKVKDIPCEIEDTRGCECDGYAISELMTYLHKICTEKEYEVIKLVCLGYPQREIAKKVYYSYSGVAKIIERVRMKIEKDGMLNGYC